MFYLLPLVITLLLCPIPVEAYIGPGAGFALLSSFFVIFTTILIAVLSLLLWPFRMVWRFIRYKRRTKPQAKRLIIIGFDGQDPKLTKVFMEKGFLPNLKKLAEHGSYTELGTTYPSISPVAWSSFATGTNPARHNIFDFLNRDKKSYLPLLSSTDIKSVSRSLKIGSFQIPLEKPQVRLLRKSKPFWSLLGEQNIWSTVLRVPVTFPPDKFYGAQLSAMCVPDLVGTQGTFSLYTTRPAEHKFKEGGQRFRLRQNGDTNNFEAIIQGPENLFRSDSAALEVPISINVDREAKKALVSVSGETTSLELMQLSDWVTITFKALPGIKISGICRMMVTEIQEHFSLYITPLNIDPDKPAMPISHPSYYATYLSKKIGHFCTLGLAEDTWALNEGITNDETFLKQTYDIDRERQDMFFTSLKRLNRGSLICVFDATDRIQHMFWHYLEKEHPANHGKNIEEAKHRNAIEDIYKHNDKLIGKVMEQLSKDDVLLVLSDHGFNSFQRGVNLNGWLQKEGFLVLKDGSDGNAEWLQDVDWANTKAFSLGLTGMFLNIKGREAKGILEPGLEEQAVKADIIKRLNGLQDPDRDCVAIREVFDTKVIYDGPYSENAPDLIIGYNEGYRISWDCATGMVAGPIFEDNTKAWSGDHCVDPRLVPGVLFSNVPITSKEPTLLDIAPTALKIFGLKPPQYMEGKPLFKQVKVQ